MAAEQLGQLIPIPLKHANNSVNMILNSNYPIKLLNAIKRYH